MIDINEVVWLHHAAWGVGEGRVRVAIEASICEY